MNTIKCTSIFLLSLSLSHFFNALSLSSIWFIISVFGEGAYGRSNYIYTGIYIYIYIYIKVFLLQ